MNCEPHIKKQKICWVMTTLRTTPKTDTIKRKYTSLVWAWVLSCLVFAAGFDSVNTLGDVSVNKQSPLAHFSHEAGSYSLRFHGLRLFANGNDHGSDDSEPDYLAQTSTNTVGQFAAARIVKSLHVETLSRFYLHYARAPPLILK
jgi:hypothetical protein